MDKIAVNTPEGAIEIEGECITSALKLKQNIERRVHVKDGLYTGVPVSTEVYLETWRVDGLDNMVELVRTISGKDTTYSLRESDYVQTLWTVDALKMASKKVRFSDVLTLQEAGEVWGIPESTMKDYLRGGKFTPDEARKTGKNWIITCQGMERVYNKKPLNDIESKGAKIDFGDVLSCPEAAAMFNLTESKVKRYLREGKFPPDEARRSGKFWFVTKQGMEKVFK